ncbi:hypothetical protein AMTRI_Chr09g22050 [Amborella trichopoda]|uniref:uncharacterized protein LOC18441511 isoform X2 n=1 Tax=Amborella trichopoda TaxID=13333 RepID=UPI0005D34DA2|nr:uncharacterized protein LOC18441511 isoform X2 [Amborella trichopoda]|eukprot:XP_011626041.1 uncharacterized protein LOC18441511 isoform X2 [Amborella trichopoda]
MAACFSLLNATTVRPFHSRMLAFNTLRRRVLLRRPFSEKNRGAVILGAASIVLIFAEKASPAEFPVIESILSQEPKNALSLPTWAIHVSSVAEWVSAMILVWQYGEKPGYETWKGLSWAMVPLLGGAFCACTWHFFYNSESLDVLVALQAALTVIGNTTMCIAAFRIFKSTQGDSKSP